MTLLNAADAIHHGSVRADAVYLGAAKVWQQPVLTLTGTPITTGSEYEDGIGSAYAGFTVTASGGTPPYYYILASGSWPNGIVLNPSTGVVSGVPGPGSAGVYNITIMVLDSNQAVGKLAPFTLTIAHKDPYWSNVAFLLDYDAADGDTSFVDQKNSLVGTPGPSAKNSTGVGTGIVPPYGTSSIYMGNGYIQFADNPMWNIGAANFTIDFMLRPSSLSYGGSVTFMIAKFGNNAPDLAWVFYFSNSGQVAFNLSTTGSDNLNPIITPAGSLVAGVWSRWRLDYDGTNFRIYKNGTMLTKVAASYTITSSVSKPLMIGANSDLTGWFYNGNCRGIRLTVGVARTASDSGYSIVNEAFPSQ